MNELSEQQRENGMTEIINATLELKRVIEKNSRNGKVISIELNIEAKSRINYLFNSVKSYHVYKNLATNGAVEQIAGVKIL
jgi:hypothetical protein